MLGANLMAATLDGAARSQRDPALPGFTVMA
jgi:hypothetical protein